MDAADLRQETRALVRALGVFDDARTPCGVEVSVREAYALDVISTAEAGLGPLSQSELQAALRVDKSNVTRLVQQLVASEWVEQRVSDEDGRVRRLHLTARGRRVARKVEESSLRRFEAIVARIPACERGGVLRALEVLRTALAEGQDLES